MINPLILKNYSPIRSSTKCYDLTCRDFSRGNTRLHTRHFMPLGELDPSKIKCEITSARGRPLLPESWVELFLLRILNESLTESVS